MVINSIGIYDIQLRQVVLVIKNGDDVDPTKFPHSYTITANVSDAQSVSMSLDGSNPHLETAKNPPYSIAGDNNPITLAIGQHSVVIIAFPNKDGTGQSISQTYHFNVAIPVLGPLKGLDGCSHIPLGTRALVLADLSIKGTREWINHSDRFSIPPSPADYADVVNSIDWFLNNNPKGQCVITNAREGLVVNGKLTRTQCRPPIDSTEMNDWTTGYYNAVAKPFGKSVIHQLGNEIDNTTSLGGNFGPRYYRTDAQPSTSKYNQTDWVLKSYIDSIQRPFYTQMKQLGGDSVVIAGFSITYNSANFTQACNFGYADTCDIGDVHRYANSTNDWVSTFSVCKAAMKGKPLMASEWGAVHTISQSHQAQLITEGWPLFKDLDYAFYYLCPAQIAPNHPGIYLNGPVQPLYNAFKGLKHA